MLTEENKLNSIAYEITKDISSFKTIYAPIIDWAITAYEKTRGICLSGGDKIKIRDLVKEALTYLYK